MSLAWSGGDDSHPVRAGLRGFQYLTAIQVQSREPGVHVGLPPSFATDVCLEGQLVTPRIGIVPSTSSDGKVTAGATKAVARGPPGRSSVVAAMVGVTPS